jgi:hypothetical protein
MTKQSSPTKKKTPQTTSGDPTRLINREVLRLLGYEPTENGLYNASIPAKILEVRSIDDGSIADFTYCCHPTKDQEFISEHSFAFYKARVKLRETPA